MKIAVVFIALFLSALVPTGIQASTPVSEKDLAKVSLFEVNRDTKLDLQTTSNEGFVVIATQDCLVLINGTSTPLKAGEYKRVSGKLNLELAQSGNISIPFFVVEILSARQPLTIEETTLAPNQRLEDASDRNSTLLLAIVPLRLSDVRDLANEGEP